MPDARFSVEVVSGVPVVVTPEEIDITNADGLRAALLEAGRGEVRLVITGAAVLRIFAITGLDSVIPHFASLEDALAATARSTESG
jgi:anti-anti-sigma regulatory factor